MVSFAFNFFWIIFIAVTCLNALYLKKKSQSIIAENPKLAEGYDKLIKGFLIFGNIPWIIMGLGILTGQVESVFDYLNLRSLNFFVILFISTLIILWILLLRWIFFKNGANFLEEHPGLMTRMNLSGNKNLTATQIKIFIPLMILGGVVALVLMWFHPAYQ